MRALVNFDNAKEMVAIRGIAYESVAPQMHRTIGLPHFNKASAPQRVESNSYDTRILAIASSVAKRNDREDIFG